MLALYATLKIKPGRIDDFLRLLGELAVPTRAEPGNRLYVFGRGPEPDSVVMLERYVDRAALKAHFASPHFQAAGAALGDFFAEPPQSVRFDEIES